MIRIVAAKVMWVGRTAAAVFGLALVLALVFGVASMASGANGQNFILGSLNNAATAVTKLTGNVPGGPALQVTNLKTDVGSRALQLNVAGNKPPLAVNATAGKATNLNADKIDGQEASAFLGSDVVVRTNDATIPATSWGQGRATCQAGEIALAGGGYMDGSVTTDAIMDLYPINSVNGRAVGGDTPKGWDVWAYNGHDESRLLTAYAICAALP
jgi:hypothetical protein